MNKLSRVEPKRIKAFRLDLAKAIPKFPNDRKTLQTLESKSLGSLLVDYCNWAVRYVAPRPRKVIIEATAFLDPRWQAFQAGIEAFLEKVRTGQDLTPHLSIEPHTHGFTPAASLPDPDGNRWADKDFMLNIMGYHHFHLGLNQAANGTVGRTNELLFAQVTRETLTVIALTDHSVFKNDLYAPMTPERERLWQIFEERSTRGTKPGSVVALSLIANSGHSPLLNSMASNYADLITAMDHRLDDSAYMASLPVGLPFELPKNPKWTWGIYFLDLGPIEQKSRCFLPMRKGPN